jgi:YesN/AraC family two-component response regulator
VPLTFLQEQAIDMVLTDYCMPEMTGYDLLKAVKVQQIQSLHFCRS